MLEDFCRRDRRDRRPWWTEHQKRAVREGNEPEDYDDDDRVNQVDAAEQPAALVDYGHRVIPVPLPPREPRPVAAPRPSRGRARPTRTPLRLLQVRSSR